MPDRILTPETAKRTLKWPLRLTLLGMVAERLVRAFWPLWTIVLLISACLLLGAHEVSSLQIVWVGTIVSALGLGWFSWRGIRKFRLPHRAEALDRLDRTLPGRPIAAITDTQAIGTADSASIAVWKAHVAHMARRIDGASPVSPDLRISRRDPYGLRFAALIAFLTALVFGSLGRVASVGDVVAGGQDSIMTGPSWEGWVEPPAYTGKPDLYLNDIPAGSMEVPENSRITLRIYGEATQFTVTETISGASASPTDISVVDIEVKRTGALSISGPGGRDWRIHMISDETPDVELIHPVERKANGEMRQPFAARDDYGVAGGTATLTLDLDVVDRRHGLAVDPEPRDPIALNVPMPISGSRENFEETLVERFSEHPWANLPVKLSVEVEDAIGQKGVSETVSMYLAGRRFFDQMAAAIAEQRRDLLWSRENGERVGQILRAISNRPEGFVKNEKAYLLFRMALRRLETGIEKGLDEEGRDEVAEMLWRAALQFEEGDLSNASERLQRAQDRLSEAMRNGATDEEIAELMRELREAMQDYMRALAERDQRDENGPRQADNQNMQEINGDQLQAMLNRLQELMEQGRMAEAQQLLDQLRQMMENMQVARGQQSRGEQAMEGLAETLRQQQGLSDEAFRELQERFNPNAQAGQNGQNQGFNGEQGSGERHEGQGQGALRSDEQSLADRQRALRDELQRQQRNFPGTGSLEGDAARDALDRAGEAMDGAEQALREDRLADALDSQAEAMEALREGIRNLGQAMAQQQRQNRQDGQRDNAQGDPLRDNRDPLGRQAGNQGRLGTDDSLLQGEDVYRRAQELLDEIRQRSGDRTRPPIELEYLQRLLDRF
ncbi:MAG: DUF4175 domain-containing protein [Pseudomonadota bacterium]